MRFRTLDPRLRALTHLTRLGLPPLDWTMHHSGLVGHPPVDDPEPYETWRAWVATLHATPDADLPGIARHATARNWRRLTDVEITGPVFAPSSATERATLLTQVTERLTDAALLEHWLPTASDETRHVREDWAEFVTEAVTAAAANVGTIEGALAGRPGSWEADALRSLLWSSAGDDDGLLRHRTRPLVVTVPLDHLMLDNGCWNAYDQATAELYAQREALPPDADEEHDRLDDLDEALEAQRAADWTRYAADLTAAITAAAADLPDLAVPVTVDVREGYDSTDEFYNPVADRLLEKAIDTTPLPGNGAPPLDRLQPSHTPS